jgi:antitoxin (DNA-binding transcriptional repressor) of toxin-antitoxin stability system
MTVGEFKARFSEARDAVRAGETVIVSDGRNRSKLAALVPYSKLEQQRKPRPLGLLKGKATVRFAKDFAVVDESLLSE